MKCHVVKTVNRLMSIIRLKLDCSGGRGWSH